MPEAGKRLDLYVAEETGLSRSRAQQLITEGLVLVCGVPREKNYKLRAGDEVSITLPEAREPEALPEDIPVEIVYEDEWLLVVNKPKGMVVHPAPGNETGTLVNALLHHCGGRLSGIGGVLRPGIVHRIDKDTSGLLAVAKCDRAHTGLAEMIKVHDFEREYRAVLLGHPRETEFTVDAPIGRSVRDRKKMAVTEKNSKAAVTHFAVLEELPGHAYVRARLTTGRTHQIRVHAAYVGHPVAGDTVYGPKKPVPGLVGQCLHAAKLGFRHPVTGEELHFEAPLPDYFAAYLEKLRRMRQN